MAVTLHEERSVSQSMEFSVAEDRLLRGLGVGLLIVAPFWVGLALVVTIAT